MTIDVESPDGSRVIEFPEGTPMEVINRVAAEQFGGGAQPEAKPTGLSELTGGMVTREGFEMGGGMIGAAVGGGAGAVAGAPTGPGAAITSAAGVLAGGALGADAGSMLFDTTENFLKFIDVLEGDMVGAVESTLGGLDAAREDLLFGGGFAVAGAGIGLAKPLLGKVLGLRAPEMQAVARQAEVLGIGVGAVDIAQGTAGRILRGSGRVLGIFPFIGGSFRRAAGVKAAQVDVAVDNVLNALAPNATLADDLGIDMTKAARGANAEFKTTAARLYDDFRLKARALDNPNVVPTSVVDADNPGIREAALEFVQEVKRGEITLKAEEGEAAEVLTGPAADTLNAFLTKLQKLPDAITVDQATGLEQSLEEFVKKAINDGFDVKRVVGVKKAIERAFTEIAPTSDAVKEVVDARTAASNFYAKGITLFQRPTAGAFGRVDRNIFRAGPGRFGSLNEDQIAEVALRIKSPQGIDDLAELVGKENLGKAARLKIDDAFEQALITDSDGLIKGADFDKFLKLTGLGKKKIAGSGATDRLLELSGVNPKEVRELVGIAKGIVIPRDVSDFIARRAGLGGMQAALGGATATVLIADSLLKSVGVAFLLRRAGTILSDPAQLKLMQKVLAPNVSDTVRRSNLGRLFEAVQEERTEVPEDAALGVP